MNTDSNRIIISRTDAEIIASLVMEDIRGYAQRYPDEFLEFVKSEEAKQHSTAPIKRRKSKKLKEESSNE